MKKNYPFILGVVGVVILLIGIIWSFAFPKIVDSAITNRLALVEGSELFEFWKKPPFPLTFKAYFFNVTNPSQVQMGARPIFKEIGPYVFDEYFERVNVSINEEDDTVEFLFKRTWVYNKKETACRSVDDMITMINGPLLITAILVQMLLPAAMGTVNDAIPFLYKGAKDVFVRATIKDILFDGIVISCHDPEVDFICGAIKEVLPPNIKTSNNGSDIKFAILGALNGSTIGPLVIARGIKGDRIRGQVVSYRGQTKMDTWAGPTCNMINGSESLFNPMKTPPEKLYGFGAEVCRSLYISYIEDYDYEGIPTWKFGATPEAISFTGEDDCFCPRVKDENYEDIPECPQSGLINVMPCLKVPLLISNPHFYLADPALPRFARGLKPEKRLHESFVYFEPVTGNPVSGARRGQLNIQMKRFEEITLLNNVSDGVCPLMWVEEVASAPEELREQLATALKILRILDAVKWVLIIIGILLLISSFILIFYQEKLKSFAKNVSSSNIAIIKVKKIGIEEPVSEINFNNTILYPSLYPQIYEKNEKLVRRNNTFYNKNIWQFKN